MIEYGVRSDEAMEWEGERARDQESMRREERLRANHHPPPPPSQIFNEKAISFEEILAVKGQTIRKAVRNDDDTIEFLE